MKKLLTHYYKKKNIFKKPNDLLINKKKICGILQETLIKLDKKFLVVGIGINLIKSPYIKNYPTTSLSEIVNKDFKLVHFYYDVDEWELYDRLKDPNEMNNVYNDPNYKEVVIKLKEDLKDMVGQFGAEIRKYASGFYRL